MKKYLITISTLLVLVLSIIYFYVMLKKQQQEIYLLNGAVNNILGGHAPFITSADGKKIEVVPTLVNNLADLTKRVDALEHPTPTPTPSPTPFLNRFR